MAYIEVEIAKELLEQLAIKTDILKYIKLAELINVDKKECYIKDFEDMKIKVGKQFIDIFQRGEIASMVTHKCFEFFSDKFIVEDGKIEVKDDGGKEV